MGKIIDISFWQGDVDFTKVATEVDLIIMRAAYGTSTDKKFVEYAEACRANKIPYGAYSYLTAGTVERAEKEAEYFYKVASLQKPLFYVLDVEYEAQTEQTTDAVVNAFYKKLRSMGAKKIGLYANRKRPFMKDETVNQFDFLWVPRYGQNNGRADATHYPPKHSCDLWQYTSKGSVSGIKGNVDTNMLYGNRYDLNWFLEGDNTVGNFTNTDLAEFCRKFVGNPYWYQCSVSV